MRSLLLLSIGIAAITGCSATVTPGNGNGNNGASDCKIDMPLSGAVSTTMKDDPGCGTAGAANMLWTTGVFSSSGPQTTATIGFASALKGGQTGNVAVDSISISQSQNNVTSSWSTPQGACTVSISSNTSDPDSSGIFKNRYSVSGSGSCSQAAVADPTSANQKTVTIGAFTFTGFIDPS
jgi:hypothetical protein